MTTIDRQVRDADANLVAEQYALASFWSDLIAWLRTSADYYDAAMTYEDLSRLSNAELERRGLSRDTLGRDVCAPCERRD
jgi:hypothetical protein